MLWIISIVIISAAFIIASVPRAEAQGREQSSPSPYMAIIRNVFDFVQRHYVEEVDPKILFEGAMKGMFSALGDPYSTFLPESEMTDLNDTTQGKFGGVGLYISKPVAARPDGKPLYVEVAAPIEDTPGWRAGINPGDLIIDINNESTDTLTMEEVLARLR